MTYTGQRAFVVKALTDANLGIPEPFTWEQVVAAIDPVAYKKTFRHGKMKVTIPVSVQFHLRELKKLRQLKEVELQTNSKSTPIKSVRRERVWKLPVENAGHVTEVPERVFFVKCRPQDADIIQLVRSEQRVFIGYPPWRRDAPYDPSNIAGCVVDLGAADEGWRGEVRNYSPSMKTNRGFALSVKKGWIVAIPRPGDGVCWLAEIADGFELVDNPSWRTQYLELRQRLGLDCSKEDSHVGDVVQSWRFSNLIGIAFGRIPRWITYRLLSRPTIGEIYGFPELGLHAHATLKRFIDRATDPPLTDTDDLHEIQRRLLTFVGPAVLEHLCVALLQLERPDEMWWHIGGSGDGGADGLGYTHDWIPKGLLQCKWFFTGSRLSDVFGAPRNNMKRILASLIHGEVEQNVQGADFWGREHIATLVRKHANDLPIARSLRISF